MCFEPRRHMRNKSHWLLTSQTVHQHGTRAPAQVDRVSSDGGQAGNGLDGGAGVAASQYRQIQGNDEFSVVGFRNNTDRQLIVGAEHGIEDGLGCQQFQHRGTAVRHTANVVLHDLGRDLKFKLPGLRESPGDAPCPNWSCR